MIPFTQAVPRPHVSDGRFSEDELRLANRNHGALLEMLALDVTPVGAHYLLTHFDVPMLDPEAYQLRFEGAFATPFTLSMDEIRALPRITEEVTLECAGNGRAQVQPRSSSMPWMFEAVGNAAWTGTRLAPLIEQAGVLEAACEVAFIGADEGYDKGVCNRFGWSLTPEELVERDPLLVYEMNGQPLLPQHGAPLRVVVPGWYGMASVKWLERVEVLTAPYDGLQQAEVYRLRADADDAGVPIKEMRVRSLMVPPGVPDWRTRQRCVAPGPVSVVGRAWSGNGVPIERVALGVGDTWLEAEVTPSKGRHSWARWDAVWQAEPGEHLLRCRAWDAEGQAQPLEPAWDQAGFCNNSVHRVPVFVSDS